jgi:sulfonate transport system substrate-binding protein
MIDRVLSRAVARLTALGLLGLAIWVPQRASAQQRVGFDYAYYSPVSLVLKDKHWLEDELGPGVTRAVQRCSVV